ncbi:MAG TPA: hypothetical protein VMY59_01140 [Candidatus Thermoplasmatota archaeon]|nr:hypothetical protein [Candidatus Thermoplasmatota archaeon]
MSRPKKKCYLCGAPCTNKTCAACLHKGKWSGLSIRRNHKIQYEKRKRASGQFYVKEAKE